MPFKIAQRGGGVRTVNDLKPIKIGGRTYYWSSKGTYYQQNPDGLMYIARLTPEQKKEGDLYIKQKQAQAEQWLNDSLKDPRNLSGSKINLDLGTKGAATKGNPEKPKNNKQTNMNGFTSAFKNARAQGLGEFTYNGRKYTTRKANETAEQFAAWKNSHNTANAPSPLITETVSDANDPKISEAPQTSTWSPTSVNTYNFNRKDVKNLGFNNYQGMVDYVKQHGDTDFSKSLVNRFGDVNNWDQSKVENDLGVSGKYRPIQGDFMKITNSMNNFNKGMGYTETQYIGEDGKFYSTQGAANAIHTLNTLNQTNNQKPNVATQPTTQTNTQTTTESTSQQPALTNFNINNYSTKNSTFNDKMNNLAKLTWNGFNNNNIKLQKGGTIKMEESQLQQAFLKFLAKETGAKSQAELEQVIQKLGKEGLQKAYTQFMQMMQQEQVQAAKFGAKLNYINKLNGRCPEGTKLTYFKEGGKLCKKCMAIQAKGGEIDKPKKNIIDDFKTNRKKSVEKIACGSKIRK